MNLIRGLFRFMTFRCIWCGGRLNYNPWNDDMGECPQGCSPD